MDRQEHLETILRLRDAMEQTKTLYEGAKAELERALESYKEFDETHIGGLRHATTTFDFMLRKHRQAVMEFNDFIRRDKLQTSPIF